VSIEQIERRTTKELGGDARSRYSGRTFGDGQGGTPLITQNVQADAAVRVDVGVVDASCEVDLGRLEWVVGWEVDC
jgi:hypothetical protein